MTTTPKWSTPNRQAYLLKLWTLYGNKCLLGHTACPIASHYIYYKPKLVTVGKAVKLPCKNRDGEPIRDKQGNQVYLEAIKPIPTVTYQDTIARLYEYLSEEIIEGWKAEDREAAKIAWEAELKAMHSLGETRLPLRGRFNNISRDIFHSSQPLFYLEAIGIDGLRLQSFAKVKLSSSYLRLYIDLGNSLRGVSKNRKRKAIRYAKPLPKVAEARVLELVTSAVRDYLSH